MSGVRRGSAADFNEAFARSAPVRALIGVRMAVERAAAAVRGLDRPGRPRSSSAAPADMETHGI